MIMVKVLTYHELITISDYQDRFKYLQLNGIPARETFGPDRWMNQRFYHSSEWRRTRDYIITRDQGFDLAHPDYPIAGKIVIHHMVPLTPDAIASSDDIMLNPDYLISCSLATHNAIHYGDTNQLRTPTERRPNDTCPWKE